MKKLFIGKLSFSTTEETLRDLFNEYGPLGSVKIVMDSLTGESRGFGFVEVTNDELANAAIQALDGVSVDGRSIVVNEARPKNSNSSEGSYRSGGDRSGGRGGYRDSHGPRRSNNFKSSGNSRY
jgi:cold-inducible RNA-binding protein